MGEHRKRSYDKQRHMHKVQHNMISSIYPTSHLQLLQTFGAKKIPRHIKVF